MNSLASFLSSCPAQEGIYRISAPRPFQHDEFDYDRQYKHHDVTNEMLDREAGNLIGFCTEYGLPAAVDALEIGCGTGRVAAGLARHPAVRSFLVTDPSPAFCLLTQRRMEAAGALSGKISIAQMTAEDIARLPAESFHLIVIKSVLHHILDYPAFLGQAARTLAPGGIVACEEPFSEGYMILGFAAQFIPMALNGELTEAERGHVQLLVDTMRFYCRRDLDKSTAEDKHLFHPADLLRVANANGLEFDYVPNWSYLRTRAQNLESGTGYFRWFFRMYLEVCMSWPAEFADRAAAALNPYLDFFSSIDSHGHSVPGCMGVAVFRKR